MPSLLVLRVPTADDPELEPISQQCTEWGAEVGWDVRTEGSGTETDLIDRIHASDVDAFVLDVGGLADDPRALADALATSGRPTVGVRATDEPAPLDAAIVSACVHTINGRGTVGFRWAIRHLAHRFEWTVETRAYGPDPNQFLDIRRPAGDGPRDAVVLLHGGFWRNHWTRETTEGIAIDLTRRGYLTANAEYRRVGSGGGWPSTVDDVVAAVAGVTAMAGVRDVVVIGHSAGGHLAVHAAAPNRIPFVSMAGALDLELGLREGHGQGAIPNFLGDAPASEATAVSVPPVAGSALVHGTADEIVPIGHSRSYSRLHPGVRLIELDGVDHHQLIERSSEPWQAVADAVATAIGR